jgi:hypothetical protein
MCIIILNKKNIIPEEQFLQSWDNNPDGAGMAYIENGQIIIKKELNDPEKFYLCYLSAREKTTCPILLHFRISTSGKIDRANCHPFLVNKQLAFAHNGIIWHTTDKLSGFSDTMLFNKLILQRLPANFLDRKGIVELIRGYIDSSKLVFLHGTGRYDIINERLGHWSDGNWYSNKTYKPTIKEITKWDSQYWDDQCWNDPYKTVPTYNQKNTYKYLPSHDPMKRIYLFCEYCGDPLKGEHEKTNGCCNICLNEFLAAHSK